MNFKFFCIRNTWNKSRLPKLCPGLPWFLDGAKILEIVNVLFFNHFSSLDKLSGEHFLSYSNNERWRPTINLKTRTIFQNVPCLWLHVDNVDVSCRVVFNIVLCYNTFTGQFCSQYIDVWFSYWLNNRCFWVNIL